jgi:hypothetical protein
LEKLISYFFFDYHLKFQTLWFKRLLFVFVILKSIYWLCYFDLLFGNNSIVYLNQPSIGVFKNFAFLLNTYPYPSACLIFILLILGLSCIGLFRHAYFIPDLFLWFLVITIHNRIYPTLTGGDHLLSQFLFFNILLSKYSITSSTWQSSLKIVLHNLAVIAVITQICLVYFLSALAKLTDEGWLSGKALISISQINHFSLFSLNYKQTFSPFLVILNYLVLFYQLLFPFFIWFKKIKKPLLIFGILMHIYIAFVMGILAFGVIMVLAYVYFWPMKEPVS